MTTVPAAEPSEICRDRCAQPPLSHIVLPLTLDRTGTRYRHLGAWVWSTSVVTSAAFDPTSLPHKRVGSGVLLRNPNGDVLLVEPTYKESWEIPGGVVEDGESPREAAIRECMEELGVELPVGKPACIHYAPMVRIAGDGIMFVFDAGTTRLTEEDFVLPADEIRSAKFVAPDDLAEYLHAVMVSRVLAAIDGADSGQTVYLER